jgi:GNAT superfamily N-acetyltransferase
MSLTLETLTGAALRPVLPDLARLRCTVFAEWPYLYAGDAEREAAEQSWGEGVEGAAIVVARDGDTLVGLATCRPLAGCEEVLLQPFARRGIDPALLCYFGESVLLPAYRGRGLGHAFFDGREAHARQLGLSAATFCAVVRNDNDPRRPAEYRPLQGFWRQRGYLPRPDLSCVFDWREHGDDRETPHAMGFWLREAL